MWVLSYSLIAQPSNTKTVEVKQSSNGMYLLLSDKTVTSLEGVRSITISRSVNDAKPTDLGIVMPAASISAFEKIVAKDALLDIAKIKKLTTKEQAFAYTQQHPSLKDYGLLAFNLDLGVALGAYFLDNNISGIKNGDKITYTISILGDETMNMSTSIIFGQKPTIEKPTLLHTLVSDSLIEISWMLSRRNSPDAFFGNIYVQEGSPSPYNKVGTTMAVNSSSGDTLLLRWTQEVKKGYAYSFYVVPTTIAFYEGIASDTTTVISINENAIAQPSDLQAVDTSNGILLTWKNPVKVDAQRMWLLQRTHEVSKPYINIATLDPRNTNYLDQEVMPSEQYYYRIRTITLNNDTLSPSSHNSARHNSAVLSPMMPENVTASTGKQGIQIKWNKVKMPDVIGYYVYRSITENNVMEQISMLVKDTTYMDTLPTYGRNRYIYGVRAFTGSNSMGYLGTSDIFIPENTIKPAAPTGLIYYVQAGSVHLAWDDASLRDRAITGYNIYRKAGNAITIDTKNPSRSGFSLVHNTTDLSWDDIATSEASISYALTAIDQYGNESEVGQVVTITTVAPHIAIPDNFTARKTSKGIAIEWNVANNTNENTYILYRRAAGETTAVKLNTVPAARQQYIDNTAKSNTLYYYSIENKTSIGTSPRSEEVVVKN